MTASGKNRKSFSEQEAEAIKTWRLEGKSADTIAAIMHVGKDRVRRFLTENNLNKYQPAKRRRQQFEVTKIINTKYPEFKNAACRNMPIADFFPVNLPNSCSGHRRKLHMEKTQKVIDVCRSCVEQEACLDYALKAEPHGIWGGTTEGEREYLRRRLGIKCERDSFISRKSREIASAWQTSASIGVPFLIKHSDIIDKRLARRA